MENRKLKIIALWFILLLTLIIIMAFFMKQTQSNNVKIALDSSEFQWREVFDNSSSEISKEDKNKMYTDALESSLEKAIIEGFKEIQGSSVEIDQTNKDIEVTITLNIDLQTKIDENDIEGIYLLALGSIGDLSKENIIIINQNGEKIN